MVLKIIVKDLLSRDLGANYQAKELFEENINVADDEEVILDFEGVLAMGRSFAQQYWSQKLRSDKKVTEINQPEMVYNLLRVVRKDFD